MFIHLCYHYEYKNLIRDPVMNLTHMCIAGTVHTDISHTHQFVHENGKQKTSQPLTNSRGT